MQNALLQLNIQGFISNVYYGVKLGPYYLSCPLAVFCIKSSEKKLEFLSDV
jgi:hypothetical protein